MDNPSNKKKERDLAFDALRGVAIIFVVAIHATDTGWDWYHAENNSWNYDITLILKQFYVFAVPAFFFISGYFTDKGDIASFSSYLNFVKTRSIRLLLPYFFWSMVVILLFFKDCSTAVLIKYLLFGTALGPYYFIIVLFILTLATPFIVWLSERKYGFHIVVLISSATMIVLYYFRTTTEHFDWYFSNITVTSWMIFYFIGIHIKLHDMDILIDRLEKAITLLAVAVILSNLEAFYLTAKFGTTAGGDSAIKFSSFLYSYCIIAIFLILRKTITKWPPALIYLGECSYGIYLIHEIFRWKITDMLANIVILNNIQPIFQLIVVILTLILCVLLINIGRFMWGKKLATNIFGF